MWRAFFLAFGINLCLLGAQCLVVEKAVLANHAQSANKAATAQNSGQPQSFFQSVNYRTAQAFGSNLQQNQRVYEPEAWLPWSLLASGAIVILYTHALPKRNSSEKSG
jgi:hypothetical protein